MSIEYFIGINKSKIQQEIICLIQKYIEFCSSKDSIILFLNFILISTDTPFFFLTGF